MQPLLQSISDDLKLELRRAGHERSFGEGEEIVAEGESALHLPVVLTGQVKMLHFLEPGKEVIIGIFGDGEVFAIPPVFDGGRYPATAIAMVPSRLLIIDRGKFLDLLRDHSELSFHVISWMCSMLREKTATIQNLATASPEHRVGNVLLRLAAANLGELPFRVPLRREDIAKMAGITTETAIRAIRRLADKGLVEIDHGKIVIRDDNALRRHVAG